MLLMYKAFPTVLTKRTPSADDMDQINHYTLEKLEPADVFIGKMALANDQYDRSHERFPETYLTRFAETIVGRSVLTGHDYESVPVGRFIGAELGKRDDRIELWTTYYTLAADSLTAKIKAGIARDASIGYNPDLRLCDLCGKDYDAWINAPSEAEPCPHIAGKRYEEFDGRVATLTYGGDAKKAEAVEGSFVWLGCQYNAQTLGANAFLSPEAKAAHFDPKLTGKFMISLGHAAFSGLPAARPIKGANSLADDPNKGAGKPTPEEIREKKILDAGTRYRDQLLERVKTRYAACQMKATGEAIAKSLTEADIETLEQAANEADALFDQKHPPAGHVPPPESSGDRRVTTSGFDPLAHRPRRRL